MSDKRPVAVVTGAAGGIGGAFAQRLDQLGYRLVLVDLDRDALAARQEALGAAGSPGHETVVADVADSGSWSRLVETLTSVEADVALLVQAAGALLAGRLTSCDASAIERLVEVNLTSTLLGAQAIGPLLARSAESARRPPLPRGVLNVASVFAAVAPPGFAVYNATKAGVVAATETLRGEWGPLGLTATAVLPGVTPTGLFDRAVYANEDWREVVAQRVGAAELTPEAVADGAIDAYRRRKAVVAIGGRARLYAWLKRIVPDLVLRRVADEAARELPD